MPMDYNCSPGEGNICEQALKKSSEKVKASVNSKHHQKRQTEVSKAKAIMADDKYRAALAREEGFGQHLLSIRIPRTYLLAQSTEQNKLQ